MLGLTRLVQTAAWYSGPRLTTYYEKFTTSTTWTAPTGVSSIKLLVVAGGGSGGFTAGGGGGAGGVRYSVANVTAGTTYTITVGAGGSKPTVDGSNGNPGANSTVTGSGFTTVTATGGGYGAHGSTGSAGYGGDGGSGGGAGYYNATSGTSTGGNAVNGNGVEGWYGGNSESVDFAVYGSNYPFVAGGGGGAGSGSYPFGGWVTGGPGQYYWKGGDGGSGILDANVGGLLTATSSGVNGRIAGGGGGGVNWSDSLYGAFGSAYGVPGVGGSGGGGNGGEIFAVSPYATHYNSTQNANTTMASSGVVNTGSGGGAGQEATNGAGGSGIVILSYQL